MRRTEKCFITKTHRASQDWKTMSRGLFNFTYNTSIWLNNFLLSPGANPPWTIVVVISFGKTDNLRLFVWLYLREDVIRKEESKSGRPNLENF